MTKQNLFDIAREDFHANEVAALAVANTIALSHAIDMMSYDDALKIILETLDEITEV